MQLLSCGSLKPAIYLIYLLLIDLNGSMNINHSSETFVFMSDEDWELGRKFPNEKQIVLQVGKKEQFGETMAICSIINISDNCETQTTHFIYRQLFHHSSKIPWDIHLNLLFLFFFFFYKELFVLQNCHYSLTLWLNICAHRQIDSFKWAFRDQILWFTFAE